MDLTCIHRPSLHSSCPCIQAGTDTGENFPHSRTVQHSYICSPLPNPVWLQSPGRTYWAHHSIVQSIPFDSGRSRRWLSESRSHRCDSAPGCTDLQGSGSSVHCIPQRRCSGRCPGHQYRCLHSYKAESRTHSVHTHRMSHRNQGGNDMKRC